MGYTIYPMLGFRGVLVVGGIALIADAGIHLIHDLGEEVMWYLLKVNALIGAFVFSLAGLLILAMFAWQQAKASASALHRIYKRLALASEPEFFANSFAISRSFSRLGGQNHATSHKVQ